MIRAADAAKERLVTSGRGRVYIDELLRGITNQLDKLGGDGAPGWQRDGAYLTPEGQRLITELERSAYLRSVQDWIIRPQIKSVRGIAAVDAIGGYVKQYHVQPDPAKAQAWYTRAAEQGSLEAKRRLQQSAGR